MFNLVTSSFNKARQHWHTNTCVDFPPSSCCGARAGWVSATEAYASEDNDGALVYNRGIFIWPTKADPPKEYGTSWNVTLNNVPFTISLMLDPSEVEADDVLSPETVKELQKICTLKGTQTIHCVYFTTINEESLPSRRYETFENYYGFTRKVQDSAFKNVGDLLTETSHCLFILVDDQISQFEKCLDKYNFPVKLLKYPHKIVNRGYSEVENPRLWLYIMTTDMNATAV